VVPVFYQLIAANHKASEVEELTAQPLPA
jgi:hypothetical protein